MKRKMVSVSILGSSDKLEAVRLLNGTSCDFIHIDVMDGQFVPSINFGMPMIRSLRKVTDAFFDVHLMIMEPSRYIQEFALAGADGITVHAEACKDLKSAIDSVRACGKRVGVSLNPGTPLSVLTYVLDQVDMVLLMTVCPGFGGQTYIASSTQKIKDLKKMIEERNLDVDIEVDGGINQDTLPVVLQAGANVIVMGSSVFHGNCAEKTKYFKEILCQAEEGRDK